MKKYILRRILYLLITLFLIISFTFFLMKQLPGTPFDEEKLAMMPPEQQEAMYERYGLDKPVWEQYLIYLKNVVTGDLGMSTTYTGMHVQDIILQRIGPSLLIASQAIVIGVTIGMILGIIAAYHHNSGWDYFTMFVAVIGVSVPSFVLAALLQYFFATQLGWFPVAFWDGYANSVLPSIAISFAIISQVARFIRTEMLEVLEQDYIITAKAKGLNSREVMFKHVLRNSLIPVVTILGTVIALLFTGSLSVERIFSIPGIGGLLVDSVKANDYATIMGVTLYFSAFYVFMMLLIDIAYVIIDPRIRLKNEGGDA